MAYANTFISHQFFAAPEGNKLLESEIKIPFSSFGLVIVDAKVKQHSTLSLFGVTLEISLLVPKI